MKRKWTCLVRYVKGLFHPTPPPTNEKLELSVTSETPVTIHIRANAQEPLRQTEILTDVIQRRSSYRSLGAETPEMENVLHPYAVIVTQDCDLTQDFKARFGNAEQLNSTDKLIPNVLLAEAVSVAELIANLPIKGKDIRKRVCQNKAERYHVFQKVEAADDTLRSGLPPLGIDFKRYFTVPTDELYSQVNSSAKRRCHLNSPYLEHFGKRFADFLSRVALPKDHEIE